jgi:hypothetical protein
MTSAADFVALIGKDVPWKLMKDIYLKVVKCTPFASVKNGTVVGPPMPNPYALLGVEMTMLGDSPDAYVMAVTHKLDFYNLWLLLERGILENDETELLVMYKPVKGIKKIVPSIFPSLAFMVYPSGTFDGLRSPYECDDKPILYLYGNERETNIDNEYIS